MARDRRDADGGPPLVDAGEGRIPVGFEVVRSQLVPDSLDPEIDSRHLFLLAQKRESRAR